MFFIRVFVTALIVIFVLFTFPSEIIVILGAVQHRFSTYLMLLAFMTFYCILELVIYFDYWFFVVYKKNKLLGYLKNFVESIVLNDKRLSKKYFSKIEKIIGSSNDVVLWVDGYLKYYLGETHEAKTKFYELSKKSGDLLGGYTLFQIAKNENDKKLAYETLKHLNDKNPKVPNTVLVEYSKMEILKGNYENARSVAKKAKNKRLVAISYFQEQKDSLDILKKAYDIAYEIPGIAIAYSEKYRATYGDDKKANAILLKAWRVTQVPELFCSYSLWNNDVKFLKKLSCDTFTFYSEFAKFTFQQKLYGLSYEYFLKAFHLLKSKRVFDYIMTLHSLDDKFQIPICDNFENEYSWVCLKCKTSVEQWQVVCSNCSDIDSFVWSNNNLSNWNKNNLLYVE